MSNDLHALKSSGKTLPAHAADSATAVVPFELCLLSKKQLADYIGVTERTIESWMRQRKIPYRKIGFTVRFLVRDILIYLDAHCLVPAKQQANAGSGHVASPSTVRSPAQPPSTPPQRDG